MADVLLHIGLHRTGSTAIQLFLTENRALLRERGYLYPCVGLPSLTDVGHHLLPWSVISRDGYIPSFSDKPARLDAEARSRLWDELQAEIERHADLRGVILSSEEFSVLSGPEIAALGERLQGHRLRVIVYLRRQDDLLEALYSATIVFGGWPETVYGTIRDFAANQRTPLNFHALLTNWRGQLPAAALAPRIYDDPPVRAHVVRDFVERAGLPIDGSLIEQAQRVNVSLPVQAVEVMRVLGTTSAAAADRDIVRRAFERAYAKLGQEKPRFTLLDADMRSRLLATYAESNDAAGREFLGLEGSPFAPRDPRERSLVTPAEALRLGLLDLSRALLE